MLLLPNLSQIINNMKMLFHHLFTTTTIVFLTISTIILSLPTSISSASANVVLIYSKTGQLVTSSTLGWQTYSIGDKKQLSTAVPAGHFITNDENYKMYVCRGLVESIPTTGHTEKHGDKTVCIVSMHTEVRTHFVFELLINKGHGARLTWKPWSKFSAVIPTGAISVISAGHTEDPYVARKKVILSNVANLDGTVTGGGETEHSTSHHNHQGPDFHVGRFAPKEGLGKVIVIEGQLEKEYDDGQVLCESEPIRYEIRNVILDKWRTQITRNLTLLGSRILENTRDSFSNHVETVMSYEFDRVKYWNTIEGVSRGLPTDVYEGHGKPVYQITWGIKETVKKVETKAVSASLILGTAQNVSMNGNYTKMEAPYKATLIAFYDDTNETIHRTIESIMVSADMEEPKFEFSPIYWRHNFTIVPVTTTTTTTTTSTTSTTQATTMRNKDAQPVDSPDIIDMDTMDNNIPEGQTGESVTEDRVKTSSISASSKTSSAQRQIQISTQLLNVIIIMMMMMKIFGLPIFRH